MVDTLSNAQLHDVRALNTSLPNDQHSCMSRGSADRHASVVDALNNRKDTSVERVVLRSLTGSLWMLFSALSAVGFNPSLASHYEAETLRSPDIAFRGRNAPVCRPPKQIIITHVSDTDDDFGDLDEDDDESDTGGSFSQASPFKKPKLEKPTPFSAKLILDAEAKHSALIMMRLYMESSFCGSFELWKVETAEAISSGIPKELEPAENQPSDPRSLTRPGAAGGVKDAHAFCITCLKTSDT
ncbi:hypothetical protein NDU88_001557 [Pleurodeles waltl]|uniref:Uncharacterized protein n=1 Tax=Pleurodeles waltl TaxID=8319 RepID=A0AAV7KQL2_PLEWA|nr:hypothetical protein NDU88_001557 [Pleurodeles waltl]